MSYNDVLLDEWERGWSSSEELICPACIGDDYLRDIVADVVVDDQACSFCGADPAAEFDAFMEAFMVGVNNIFEPVDDNFPWKHDAWDLPDEFGWVFTGDHADEVLREVRDRLEDKSYASRLWIEVDAHTAFSTAWKDFREQILHRTRFVFWAKKGNDESEEFGSAGEVPVASVLEEIGRLLVKFELITTLPTGTSTYRARGHTRRQDSRNWRAQDLGTNLPDRSWGSTRMSPAGIPLFYGADDIATALTEAGTADLREFFTVGQFVTTAPIKVVNLISIPPVPSIFDPELGAWQGQIRFLHDLVEDLRQPVDEKRGNLDYVPTQVFCEYFLNVFDTDVGVRGLSWKSAVATGGGRCLALNIPQEDCVTASAAATDRASLQLVDGGITVHRRCTDEFRQLQG